MSNGRVRLSLLAMVIFFGGSLPAYKWAALNFGPAMTNLIRFVIATAVIFAVGHKHLASGRSAAPRLIVIGMFGLGLMTVFMSTGVAKGTATVGSIVVGLEPIGVALAGVLLVGDQPNRRSVVALVVGFAGALIASGVLTERGGSNKVVPILLLLGTVVTFSIYTANVRKTSRGVHPLAVAAYTHLGALAFVVPALLFDVVESRIYTGPLQGRAVGAAVFLGVGSAVAYLLLCLVLVKVPSNRVAVSMFLTPIFGVLFSWAVVREQLAWRHAVGAALVLGALWISEYSGTAKRVST